MLLEEEIQKRVESSSSVGEMFWEAREVRSLLLFVTQEPASESTDAVDFGKRVFFMFDLQVFGIKG